MSVFSKGVGSRRVSRLLSLNAVLLLAFVLQTFLWHATGVVHAQTLPRSDGGLLSAPKFLPVDDAFAFYTSLPEEGVVVVHWTIAPDYYLYREKFAFAMHTDPQSSVIRTAQLPAGVDHHDEFFGDVEVYYGQVDAYLQIPESFRGSPLQLIVEYQGCSELGLCYPPQRREIELHL